MRWMWDDIDSEQGALCRVGYNHVISNKRELNNNCCFIKNSQEILLDLADFLCKNNQKTIIIINL